MANIRSMNDLKRLNYQRERRANAANSEKAFWAAAGSAMAMIASMSPTLAANNLQTKILDAFNKIYGLVFGISTAAAVCLVTVCLVLRMISKNQRTVDEATQWMKRIIICWACIMLLTTFVGFFKGIVGSGSNNFNSVWNANAT